MNEDLHNIDDLFRSTLEHYVEIPSPAFKSNLNAFLDKQDVEAYKRKYVTWKRVAILVLIMLSGYILYESGTVKINADHSKENSTSKGQGNTRNIQLHESTTNISTANINYKSLNRNDITSSNANKPANHKTHWNAPKKVSYKPYLLTTRNRTYFDQQRIQSISAEHNTQFLSIDHALFNNRVINDEQPIKVRPFKPYWQLSGLVSYEQVNYHLDSDLPNAITSIKHREVHEPSFSGGIFATYRLKKKWAIQTGLEYSHTSIGISPQKIYAFQEPAGSIAFKYITSSGYAYIKPGLSASPVIGDSLNTAEAKHILESFSVPLSLKFVIEKNRFSFRPGLGIEANLLTSAKVEVEIEETPNKEVVFINKLYGSKPFYWSLIADAELHYRVNNKTFLTLRPSFKYALSPITEDNVVETFPYSFGAGMGITYKPR